jgi:anti-sigma regulatory factor (Ser/Thr protein kinase)
VLAADPVPRSVKAARDFTTETLVRWGLRGLIGDATVVVSELITNAIRHGAQQPGQDEPGPDRAAQDGAGRPQAELALWGRGGHLVCVVTDSNISPPVLTPSDLATEDGRGLQVVQAFAVRWGWTVLGIHRKAVWAVIGAPDQGGPSGGPPEITNARRPRT